MSDDLTIPSPAYRVPRRNRSGTDSGTKRLVIIAGGLGVTLVTIIAGSALIGRGGGGDVPVIQADNRPIRSKPENPGGLQVAGANNEIFSGSDTTTTRLAPAAEVPDPKGLRAPTPPTLSAAPAPAAITQPPPATKPEPAQVTSATKPATVAAPQSKPVAVAPPQVKPVTAPAAAVPAPMEKHVPAASKVTSAQLAAVSSEVAAKAEWQSLTKRMPDLLNGRQPVFTKTERDGRTFWRIRTSGFSDVNEAKIFCERVHAKGGGCTVADF